MGGDPGGHRRAVGRAARPPHVDDDGVGPGRSQGGQRRRPRRAAVGVSMTTTSERSAAATRAEATAGRCLGDPPWWRSWRVPATGRRRPTARRPRRCWRGGRARRRERRRTAMVRAGRRRRGYRSAAFGADAVASAERASADRATPRGTTTDSVACSVAGSGPRGEADDRQGGHTRHVDQPVDGQLARRHRGEHRAHARLDQHPVAVGAQQQRSAPAASAPATEAGMAAGSPAPPMSSAPVTTQSPVNPSSPLSRSVTIRRLTVAGCSASSAAPTGGRHHRPDSRGDCGPERHQLAVPQGVRRRRQCGKGQVRVDDRRAVPGEVLGARRHARSRSPDVNAATCRATSAGRRRTTAPR